MILHIWTWCVDCQVLPHQNLVRLYQILSIIRCILTKSSEENHWTYGCLQLNTFWSHPNAKFPHVTDLKVIFASDSQVLGLIGDQSVWSYVSSNTHVEPIVKECLVHLLKTRNSTATKIWRHSLFVYILWRRRLHSVSSSEGFMLICSEILVAARPHARKLTCCSQGLVCLTHCRVKTNHSSCKE